LLRCQKLMPLSMKKTEPYTNSGSSGGEITMENLRLRNVQVGGICMNDYPDLVDAYICYAEDSKGNPLTEEQLEALTNNNQEFVQEMAHDEIMGWV
jgi:hypothetical protein